MNNDNIIEKKGVTIWSFLANKAAPILWTGASPQRYGEHDISQTNWRSGYQSAYLIVESTLLIEEIEEFGVCFTSPQIQVADLEIAPD